MEKIIKDFLRGIASKGGKATKKKFGWKHYQKIGKKGAKARWAKVKFENIINN